MWDARILLVGPSVDHRVCEVDSCFFI